MYLIVRHYCLQRQYPSTPNISEPDLLREISLDNISYERFHWTLHSKGKLIVKECFQTSRSGYFPWMFYWFRTQKCSRKSNYGHFRESLSIFFWFPRGIFFWNRGKNIRFWEGNGADIRPQKRPNECPDSPLLHFLISVQILSAAVSALFLINTITTHLYYLFSILCLNNPPFFVDS
jgi:hypothetical protein